MGKSVSGALNVLFCTQPEFTRGRGGPGEVRPEDARKRASGPDPVPHWCLMPESGGSYVLMSFAFYAPRHQIPKE